MPDPTVPELPLLSDGTLPPVALLLRWLGQARPAPAARLDALPPGNGSLPDLLRLGGIAQLVHGGLEAFRWEGCAGARVLVDGDGDEDAPLHHGHLPADATWGDEASAIHGLIDLARLEDASAALADGSAAPRAGAAWDHILAAAGMVRTPPIPPLAGHGLADAGQLGAWNPLPFARRQVVSLPMPPGTAPWGLRDQRGARHPVQVVEGPRGQELLVELALGALECRRFAPDDDPVAGANWEVSRTVLDNGRVRAELDPLGQIVRLCWDGRFARWAGPAPQALVDGLPLSGGSSITVLEDGPVRARLAVSRSGPQGTLHLTYTLHAHEDVLRVAVSWDGAGELVLDHPTPYRDGELRVAGELAPWSMVQAARAGDEPAVVQPGVRWATLGEGHGEAFDGLALLGARPLSVSAQAGHLRLHVGGALAYALAPARRLPGSLGLGQLALAIGVPGRVYSGATDLPSALRLEHRGGVTPWWVGRPADWRGEVVLGDQSGAAGRCVLFAPGLTEAWRVDAGGSPLQRLPATPEADGAELDLAGHELAIVRWR